MTRRIFVSLILLFSAATAEASSYFSQQCLRVLDDFDYNPGQSDPYRAIDSWGKPVAIARGSFTSLGSFKACSKIRGFQHLTLDGSLRATTEISLISLLGICMPTPCANENDIRIMFVQLIREINNLLAGSQRNESLTLFMQLAVQSLYGSVGSSKPGAVVAYRINKVAPTHNGEPWTVGAFVMISIWLCFIVIVLLASAMDWAEKRGLIGVPSSSTNEEIAPMLPPIDKARRPVKRSVGRRLLKCFSLYDTLPAMFSCETRRFQELQVLNVVRVISIWWVVLGHTIGRLLESGSVDILDMLALFKQSSAMVLVNAFFSVDTFFFLSAFLVAYMMFADEQSVKRFTFVKYTFMRYLRLTPAYAMAIFSWWQLLPLAGKGPLWYQLRDEINESCPKYWWTQLLYFNNFYPDVIRRECMPWGWYLAADYHLYMLAPLFIFALLKFRGNRRFIAYAIVLGGFIAQALITMIPAAIYHTPAVPTPSNASLRKGESLTAAVDDWHRVFYQNSYNHISIMLMGILSAWIAVRIRQKRTEKSILLQQEMHQRWNQWYVLVSHLVGGALLLLVIYLPFDYVKNLERWPLAANIVYLYFSRIVWSAGIALLILPTIINPRQTSLMTALFAWKPWAVLSRLTYSVYMVHVMVIHWLIDTRQREDSFTPQLGIAYYGGVVWWSYLLGGLLFLIVEQPVAQLLKMLVGR